NPGANWYFLESKVPQFDGPGTLPIAGTINTLAHTFNPILFNANPQGTLINDQMDSFGSGFYAPLLGTWDPPMPSAGTLPPVVKLVSGTYTDVAVEAKVDSVADGGSAALVSRQGGLGQGDEYRAGLIRQGSTYSAEIWKVVGGTWTQLDS